MDYETFSQQDFSQIFMELIDKEDLTQLQILWDKRINFEISLTNKPYTKNHHTPLVYAFEKDKHNVVDFLLDLKVQTTPGIFVRYIHENTSIISYACRKGWLSTVQKIVSRQNLFYSNSYGQDLTRDVICGSATLADKEEIINLLLKNGVLATIHSLMSAIEIVEPSIV